MSDATTERRTAEVLRQVLTCLANPPRDVFAASEWLAANMPADAGEDGLFDWLGRYARRAGGLETADAYRYRGDFYCDGCVECEDAPCLAPHEQAAAELCDGVGTCACCGRLFPNPD